MTAESATRRPPAPEVEPSIHHAGDARALARVADELSEAALIPIDTESNSLHAYKERVCFVQIQGPDQVHLVDTVAHPDLSVLANILGGGSATKILHGADYDVVCMKRDFGFGPRPLFDTMLAAQMLGQEALGYGALVERYCDVQLDKGFQKHDWGARPLDPVAEPYLVDDVRYLTTLHDALTEELGEADLTEEIAIEFRRVEGLEWTSRQQVDPDPWLRMKGAKDLDRKGLAILREVHQLREELAEAADRPPFKVMGNHQLLLIAERRPKTEAQLSRIAGFNKPHVMRRVGSRVLDCVSRGLERVDDLPRDLKPRRKVPREGRGPDQNIEEALRDWRRKATARSGLTSLALLPNHVMLEVARVRPRRASEVEELEGMRTRRRAALAREIFEVARAAQ